LEREDWNRRYLDREHEHEPPAEPNRFVFAELAALAPGRALDLGCGMGRNAVWLAEGGWDVTAVDFSDVAVRRARRLAARRGVRVEWLRADLRNYAPPEGAFDLVLLAYVHLPREERRLVLRRAAAALAPGGTLLAVGHDLRNLTEGWGGPSNPDVLYTPDDLVADLEGLAIERAERVTRTVETDEGEAEAVDALVRAQRPA
jgi:SAM-dependent methyltransferase